MQKQSEKRIEICTILMQKTVFFCKVYSNGCSRFLQGERMKNQAGMSYRSGNYAEEASICFLLGEKNVFSVSCVSH
jgi:hypothetical protein